MSPSPSVHRSMGQGERHLFPPHKQHDGGGGRPSYTTQGDPFDASTPSVVFVLPTKDTPASAANLAGEKRKRKRRRECIAPCRCNGDTKFVLVDCLCKWHTAETYSQVCLPSSVDATCSVCKSAFKSDFKLKDGRCLKLLKSSLEAPHVSLITTKHETAQRLFNTRFQLSFSTLLKPDGHNGTRPLLPWMVTPLVRIFFTSIRFKIPEFIFMDPNLPNASYCTCVSQLK